MLPKAFGNYSVASFFRDCVNMAGSSSEHTDAFSRPVLPKFKQPEGEPDI
jgi:hypothetical protein